MEEAYIGPDDPWSPVGAMEVLITLGVVEGSGVFRQQYADGEMYDVAVPRGTRRSAYEMVIPVDAVHANVYSPRTDGDMDGPLLHLSYWLSKG